MRAKSAVKSVGIQTAQEAQIGEGVDLGMWLGRRQAFALMAGRCSAADAECIREVRRNKRYRTLRMTWNEFCEKRLGISRVSADKIIRQFEEFGPDFFTLAQLTRVTPEEYRRLGLAVRGHALLHAGAEIPIAAENGPQLSAAIEELRREAKVEAEAVIKSACATGEQEAPRPPEHTVVRESGEIAAEPSASPGDAMSDAARGISQAEQSLHAALSELERLQARPLDLGHRLRLHALVSYGWHKFNLLQLEVRV